MNFISLAPFVPSGDDFEKAKDFFQEIGFIVEWDYGELAGFSNGNCHFILQKYDNRLFAENLMISVKVSNIFDFWNDIIKKNLSQKYDVPIIQQPVKQPYGHEVNIIDRAGVCWHFIEELS